MNAKQIAEKINACISWSVKNLSVDDEAKAWEKHGKCRIYAGTAFVDIHNGIATASTSIPRQGFYERNSDFADRKDAERKMVMPIDVIARYTNILLKK